MKPDKHFIAAACSIAVAVCLIALTWLGTARATRVQRLEVTAPVTASLVNQARAFAQVGLDDAKVCCAVGPASAILDAKSIDKPMFAALEVTAGGIWTCHSTNDAVQRFHAFRRLPGRNFVMLVAMNQGDARRPAALGRQQADLVAACITVLLAGLALVPGARRARRRKALNEEDREALAASNAELEIARALSAAKAERLEATLSGMSDGVSLIDANMQLVEWNARFPEIAGVPDEILRVGLPMEEILRAQIRTGQFGRVLDPEAEVARRMAHLRVAPFGVTQRQRPDGGTLELRRNRLPDGGFVTLYADITERKLSEAALRRATDAAKAANTEKSQFVAIVSHEIRTPLNTLLNSVRLLGDSVLLPAQRSLVVMALRSGDALFGLINDILELSQMEAGRLSIRPNLFELRPVLETSVEMFAAQAAERGITIHLTIAAGTPETLLTDPGRLRQVQLNLLSNAVKYARPGGIWLTAEPGDCEGQAVRLTVRDEGPVIAPEARTRLFHPFSRLNRPEGDDAVGTGLGLSICHHLVALMGGEIGWYAWHRGDVSSGQRLEGNAFWVTLPATMLPPRSAQAQADAADPFSDQVRPPAKEPSKQIGRLPRRRPPRTRILLTEDIVATQLVTATVLRREGHYVDIAVSGAAAIRAVQAAPYDLIFMDGFMPGMSGQEATQIIRRLKEPAGLIPIVALTANTRHEDQASFTAAGMDGILGKPVSTAELLAVLDKYVWARHAAGGGFGGTERATAMLEKPAAIAAGVWPILVSERINELRVSLPPETFAHLIEQCVADMEARLPALLHAVASGTPTAITAHAHALVGMAANYGMAAIEARLRLIMAAACESGVVPPGPAVAELEADFADTARTLRNMVRSEVA